MQGITKMTSLLLVNNKMLKECNAELGENSDRMVEMEY